MFSKVPRVKPSASNPHPTSSRHTRPQSQSLQPADRVCLVPRPTHQHTRLPAQTASPTIEYSSSSISAHPPCPFSPSTAALSYAWLATLSDPTFGGDEIDTKCIQFLAHEFTALQLTSIVQRTTKVVETKSQPADRLRHHNRPTCIQLPSNSYALFSFWEAGILQLIE